MSRPVRRLGSALGLTAAILASVATTSVAHASTPALPLKLVHVQSFFGPNAMQNCRSQGHEDVYVEFIYDVYTCVSQFGYVQLNEYLIDG